MESSIELTPSECTALLASCRIGRIGVIVDGAPLVLPVNYRWVIHDQQPFVVLRTRADNVIDRAPSSVAFEIDGIDDFHRTGWSVLVQGTLHHAVVDPAVRQLIDPDPWLADERESWLAIAAEQVTGRRLSAHEPEWAFHIRGYL